MHNPLGFGASDFTELALAGIFILFALVSRPLVEPLGSRLARKTKFTMVVLLLTPILLRLILLPHHPVPTPNAGDEFSHLLVADTLSHFRLANPVHPMRRFFETFFVLQKPSYSSIYPLGQGISLALGRLFLGLPWAGVLVSSGAFCGLCYWMLRAWTTPAWALVGGVLTVVEFGPLNHWMNSYWGGSFAAAGGCLVCGALPRMLQSNRLRNAVFLGIGFGVSVLTRPYESSFLIVSVLLFFAFELRGEIVNRAFLKQASICAVTLVPVAALLLVQNKQVTGSWTTMPYVLSQQQYGVPVSLTIQPDPVPHNALTPQQASEYQLQMSMKSGKETLRTYLDRLVYRIRVYRFFFLPPLYLALLAFLVTIRDFRAAWVAFTLLLFACGTNLFPAFHFHYEASVACLFVLVAVLGLERMSRIRAGKEAARLLLFLCVAHFLFWYGVHLTEGNDQPRALLRFESWDALNHREPERRIAVRDEVEKLPGRLLVFVRYYPQHPSQDEWVWNRAAIDAARVVWARDLGAEEDRKLMAYYPARSAWLLEPDFHPLPRLQPFRP